MDAMELAAAAAAAAAARHGCKVCGKRFSCGRSLGGHMRSHLSLGEAAAAAAAEGDAGDELRRVAESGGRSSSGAFGYGLRENPRKTRRLSDFADDDEDEDEDGGDGDGDGDGEHEACRECGKLFASWRLLLGHMRSHASCGRDRDEEEDEDVDDGLVPEEAEAEAETAAQAPSPVTVLPPAPRRRRRSMRVAAPPPVLGEFDQEQEDVARCLLMLSQDTSLWSSPPVAKTGARKKAAAKQPPLRRKGCDDPAPLQHGEAKAGAGSGGVARGRKRSSPAKQQCEVAVAAPKRTRYECPGCGKVFSSYQALGGHRASHKRINTSCSAPKVAAAAPEPSSETCTSFSTLSPSASPDSVAIGIDKVEAGFLDLNFPPAPPEEA